MTKTEWDKIESREKDALIAETLFCATLLGKRTVIDNIQVPFVRLPDGKGDRLLPFYTTDRNASALVLNEVEQRLLKEIYLYHLMDMLFGRDCWLFDFVDDLPALMLVHNTDPDDICYAAVKAVEEEDAKSDS